MPRIKSKQIIGETPTQPDHLTTKGYVDEIFDEVNLSVNRRRLAYFHSLGKLMITANQELYETKYKTSHTIRVNEIWTDQISTAINFTEAYNESLVNSAVKYYERVELDMIYNSNFQTYCYIENGTFKDDTYPLLEQGKITNGGIFTKPFISPEDVINSTSNEISNGYRLKLYIGDDATNGTPGDEILQSNGNWSVNYNTGTINFLENHTPNDMGWGKIKASFFKYDGKYVSDNYNDLFESAILENNSIIFNKNLISEKILDLSTLKITNSVIDISLNPTTNKLTVTKYDGNNIEINLNSVISDVVSDVSYHSGTNNLIFYKANTEYLIVNLNDVLSKYDSAFVNTFVDVLNGNLVFITTNGVEEMIPLNLLQDRTAFNEVMLNNNILKFIKQDGDISTIDMNELLINQNSFYNASFDTKIYILTLTQYDGSVVHVDLSSLKSVDGTISKIVSNNINMVALSTTALNNLATPIPLLSDNLLGSGVLVFINGIQVFLGEDETCECYFSNDGGITKKSLSNITFGDFLYWNYVNDLPVSGYDLSLIDKISYTYLKV